MGTLKTLQWEHEKIACIFNIFCSNVHHLWKSITQHPRDLERFFVKNPIFCCMREYQRAHAREWERKSNCGSVPPDAGEMTGLHGFSHSSACMHLHFMSLSPLPFDLCHEKSISYLLDMSTDRLLHLDDEWQHIIN